MHTVLLRAARLGGVLLSRARARNGRQPLVDISLVKIIIPTTGNAGSNP